ncbi:MAG: undecaprenyl-diphosphatase UppP [Deltaproteobacteria bacterium]|nr:undecaprenyl-diphosphatase UppP [Deltaproteobacteria bacterium]
MTTTTAIFLGILQGVTEFLPVSSSGHLVLAEYFLGLKDTPIAFDVTLHLGTLISVLSYFWQDWLGMAKSLVPGKTSRKGDRRLLFLVLLGTVPGAFLGYFLEGAASTIFRSPWVVVSTLSGVALLLWLAERLASHARNFKKFGWKDAIGIGTAQALAIVPGVSRSGITMTIALFLGFERMAAARFSFLLSAPIIAGAGLYEGLKLWHDGFGTLGMDFLWGFMAASISGYLVIAFLMRYLTKHTFYPFVYYRLILALIVALVLKIGWL